MTLKRKKKPTRVRLCHQHPNMCNWPIDAVQQTSFDLKTELVVFFVCHHHKVLIVLWNGWIFGGGSSKRLGVNTQVNIIFIEQLMSYL